MGRMPSVKTQLSRMTEAQKDSAIQVLAEALQEDSPCGACRHCDADAERQPCVSCSSALGDVYNFELARLEELK